MRQRCAKVVRAGPGKSRVLADIPSEEDENALPIGEDICELIQS